MSKDWSKNVEKTQQSTCNPRVFYLFRSSFWQWNHIEKLPYVRSYGTLDRTETFLLTVNTDVCWLKNERCCVFSRYQKWALLLEKPLKSFLSHILSAFLRLPDSNRDSKRMVSSSGPCLVYQRGIFAAAVAPLTSCGTQHIIHEAMAVVVGSQLESMSQPSTILQWLYCTIRDYSGPRQYHPHLVISVGRRSQRVVNLIPLVFVWMFTPDHGLKSE